MKIYSDQARRRINRAVRKVEQRKLRTGPRSRRGGVMQMVTFALADEDIEHDSFGDVKLATANTMDSTYSALNDDIRSVFNPLPKIWNGARVLIERGTLPGVTNREDGVKWIVRQAWSATRIRGTATAAIAAGATGQIENIVPLNGTPPAPEPISVYLPTAYVSIEAGLMVWAELAWNDGTSSSLWEVYSADCIEAGP